MSGTVNASIPLSFRPTPNLGPNLEVANQIAAQDQALRARALQEQRTNALRGILGKQGAIDEHGMVTPDALRQIGGVDPEAAMKIGQNNLLTQQRKLQMDTLRAKATYDQADYLNNAYAPILEQYEAGVQEGKTPEPMLRKRAQEAVDETTKRLQDGGTLTPEVAKTLPTQFDPIAFKRNAMRSSQYLDWWKEQRRREEDAKKDARTGEDTLQLPDGRVVYSRPNDPDPARRLVDNNGKPVLPQEMQGARKLGAAPPAEIPGRAGEHDAMIRADAAIHRKEVELQRPLTEDEKAEQRQLARIAPEVEKTRQKAATSITEDTPEQRESRAAQAATGMPIIQIVPGYRGDSTALRERTRQDAIKRIQDELGVGPAEAGIELANRTIEYQSGKRSSSQLTTMLGATRQAVNQLDLNIDKAKEEMAKLPSTNLSPIINAIMRGEQNWTGDPAYAGLFFYMHAVAVESARILSGGQASVAQLHQGAMDEARKWANVNMTPASFNEVAAAMKVEGRGRIKTYQEALKAGRLGAKPDDAESQFGTPTIPDALKQMQTAGTLRANADHTMFYDVGTKKYYDRSGKETAPPAAAPATPAPTSGQTPAQPAAPAPVGTTAPNTPVQIPPASQAGPRAAPPSAPTTESTPLPSYSVPEKHKNDPEGTIYKDGTGQNFIMRGNRIVAMPSDDPPRDLMRAKEAIRLGAPKAKVIEMLKGAGITDDMIRQAGIETPEEPKKKVIQQEAVGANSDRVQRETVGADGRVQEPGIVSRITGLFSRPSEEPTVTYGNRLRGYPDKDAVAASRLADFSYGTGNEAYMSGARQNALSTPPRKAAGEREVVGIPEEGASLRAVSSPRFGGGVAGTPETGDLYTQAQLAVNRSPISALGYDPRKINLDTKSGDKMTIAGAYVPDTDSGYSNASYVGNIVHESTHRGLERLRKADIVPKELWDRLPKEEDIVRYIMALHMGDPEKDRGGEGKKQRDRALRLFGRDVDDPQKYASDASTAAKERRSAMNELVGIAATYFGSLHPGGPR